MIKDFHSKGLITKDDYEGALGAYKAYINEVRSKERDEAVMISERYCYYESETREIDDETPFKTPPKRDDCPICFQILPLNESSYQSCCGKSLCDGCRGVGMFHSREGTPYFLV